MTRKKIYDPYAEVLDKFNRESIDYVVIGMSGINYYASKTQETFATQDFDVFIKPTINNTKKAIAVFVKFGYSLVAGKEKVDDFFIKDIVKNKRTIVAADPYGITFELILSVSGYTFNQMRADAAIFNIKNVPIRVAKLNKLLMSKKIAGREKDKLFLKRYEILLKEKAKKTT